MSHLDTEEQFENIKEFFAKTWKLMLAVIVIGLLALWGWRYWKAHQVETMTAASDQYELLLTKINPEDLESIKPMVDFAAENNNTYGVFADLKSAQFYVEVLKDYAGAEKLLVDATKKTSSEPVLVIINIRIARLQAQLENYAGSLQTLDKVKDNSWAAVVNDVRGDVLVKMERYPEACNAYEVALASQPTPELEKNIKMKLNQAQYLKAKQALEAEQAAKKQAEEDAKKAAEEAKLAEQAEKDKATTAPQ